MKTSQAVSGQHSLAIKKWVVPIYLYILYIYILYIYISIIQTYVYICIHLSSKFWDPPSMWMIAIVNSSFRSCKFIRAFFISQPRVKGLWGQVKIRKTWLQWRILIVESSQFSGLILSKSLPHSPAICGMAAQPSSHLDSEGHPAGVGPVSFQWAFNGRGSASCRLEMPVSPVPIRKRLGGSACPAWCGYEKIWLVDGCTLW